jgi:hypothetical protein
MPDFFVPMVDPDKQEDAYRELAAFVNVRAPEPGERVCSITWTHDRTKWTATVGEQFKGTETLLKGRGRGKLETEVPRSTNDTVLAILPGTPFVIVHDRKKRILEPAHLR